VNTQSTWCYNPEDSHLHSHHRGNLKSYLCRHCYALLFLNFVGWDLSLNMVLFGTNTQNPVLVITGTGQCLEPYLVWEHDNDGSCERASK
jgi:hypothetical protein